MLQTDWDVRFSATEHIYGEVPNDFLASVADRIPRGPVLSIGEGEGRNAVFLAARGLDVTAQDGSSVGLAKASALADRRGVNLKTIHADLSTFALPRTGWSGIVSIFCHLPSAVRHAVHAQVFEALRPGGVFVLEAYTPEQLTYRTGGPPVRDLLVTLADLKHDLVGLNFEIGRELVREIHEGGLHNGTSAVVQVLAVKPS